MDSNSNGEQRLKGTDPTWSQILFFAVTPVHLMLAERMVSFLNYISAGFIQDHSTCLCLNVVSSLWVNDFCASNTRVLQPCSCRI